MPTQQHQHTHKQMQHIHTIAHTNTLDNNNNKTQSVCVCSPTNLQSLHHFLNAHVTKTNVIENQRCAAAGNILCVFVNHNKQTQSLMRKTRTNKQHKEQASVCRWNDLCGHLCVCSLLSMHFHSNQHARTPFSFFHFVCFRVIVVILSSLLAVICCLFCVFRCDC